MFVAEMSFDDGYGTFSIFQLIDGQYLGVMLGRPTRIGKFMFFLGQKDDGDNSIHFVNSILPDGRMLTPEPVVDVAVDFDENELVKAAVGIYQPSNGKQINMRLSGKRVGYVVDELAGDEIGCFSFATSPPPPAPMPSTPPPAKPPTTVMKPLTSSTKPLPSVNASFDPSSKSFGMWNNLTLGQKVQYRMADEAKVLTALRNKGYNCSIESYSQGLATVKITKIPSI